MDWEIVYPGTCDIVSKPMSKMRCSMVLLGALFLLHLSWFTANAAVTAEFDEIPPVSRQGGLLKAMQEMP